MGGHGTGRKEYATTSTVKESKTIDVSLMADEGYLNAGASGTLSWSRNGEQFALIGFRTNDDEDVLYLSYTTSHPLSDDRTKHNYGVPITTTPCNFGGERPWFLCPGHERETCNERVGKLHCPPRGERYLCRHCHDLAYESSRKSGNPVETAKLRYERAHRKLRPDADSHFPGRNGTVLVRMDGKPDGMHWDTYEEILNDLREAHDDWWREMERRRVSMCAGFERRNRRAGYHDAADEREEWKEEAKDELKNGRLLSDIDRFALAEMGIPH